MIQHSATMKTKSYSISYKLAALDFLKFHNVSEAARKFNVDRKRIREWREQEKKLREEDKVCVQKKRKRLSGGGRKPRCEELERKLQAWICSRREERLPVSRTMIQRQAMEIFQQDGKENFAASNGWLMRFLKRFGFTLRRRTTVSQRIPALFIPKIVSFIRYLEEMRKTKKYKPGDIYVMDETPVWVEPLAETTIDRKGVKSVPIKTTGHEKVRLTVALTAKADGTKLKPYIIIPRKREIKELKDSFKDVVLSFNQKSWMDNQLTKDYLQRVIGQLTFNKRLIIWDSYACHLSSETKATMRNFRLDSAIVPAGCTSLIQAPDISWNKSLKTSIKKFYTEWLTSGEHTYSKNGNMRPPSFVKIVEWIHESWKNIPTEQICHSMKHCAITTNLDGSEDDLIHCFKTNENNFGLQLLKEERAKGIPVSVDLSDDEFECCDTIDNDASDSCEAEEEFDSSWCDSDESN